MKKYNLTPELSLTHSRMGMFTLSLRLVVGWTYFSAFWRRLVLANKLDPDAAGYIGEKFNHFLPNALGIKPMIEYLVTHPEALFWSMISFTIIEGVVGLLLMLGIFSRLMSVGVFGLAMGILLGAGWIGTTCLDEWQIGILGVATGFTLFLTGSGIYSVDHYLMKNNHELSRKKWFSWLGSGALGWSENQIKKIALIGAIGIFGLTLFTNQYFHGGLWGTLHNKSVKPKIEIAEASINKDVLSFEINRIEGVDVYGSFLIGISLVHNEKDTIMNMNGEMLSKFAKEDIHNYYVAKVKPGKHSLIIPLGAKAKLQIHHSPFENLPKGAYQVILTDISGITWQETIVK